MGRLSEIDWNLVQFKYEVLGYSLEEIQAEYELSEAHVQYISKDWHQIPASKREVLNFTDFENLENLTEEITSQIQNESTTLTTLKQKFLLPKYIELENILISKAISLASTLKEERASTAALSTLANVLSSLLQHNPLLRPAVGEEGGSELPKEWKVTVVDPKFDDPAKAETPVREEEEI